MNTARGTASIAAVTAAVMIAQQVATSAVRDAFFLANYPSSALPNAMIASSILSVAFLPVLARMMTRLGPAVVTPWTAAASALLMLGEWMISSSRPDIAAAALFVHTMVFGSTLISGFWSLFNERFDPHTAKQLMGRVAGGAALGGVIGGLLVERVGAAGVDLPNLLPMLAVAQLVAAGGSRSLQGTTASAVRTARPQADDAQESSVSMLRGSSYLQGIALLVAATAFVSTLTSFLLKAQVAATYVNGSDLLQFFARYYLVIGLVGFLLQVNLTRFSLNRFGLAATIATLPASLATLGLVAFASPSLWSIALMRGVDEALTNSLFRSGYELLYTPIASGIKRRFKAIVDVGFDRLGKTIGSGLLAIALWMFAETPLRALLAIVVIGAVASLIVALRLRGGYVRSLTSSLQSQAVSLSADVLDEAMTLRTIAGAGGIDRNKLLAAIKDAPPAMDQSASMDFSGGEAAWGTQTIFVRNLRKVATAAPTTAAPAIVKEPEDPLVASTIELRAADAYRVRRKLSAIHPLDRHLVPHVISLLGRDDVSNDAVRTLRDAGDGVVGQLVDVLLDPQADSIVRRRIPQVLAGSGSQVAMIGLLQALDDPAFELRFRAAGALVRSRDAYSGFSIPRDVVLDATTSECRRIKSTPGAGAINEEEDRGLELVFRLLSLVLDPEPVRLAQRAFQSQDAHLRGTALEYLETVVPPNVLQELRPLIGATPPARAQTRTAKEIESELLASSAAVSIDIASLRRKLRAKDDSESGS